MANRDVVAIGTSAGGVQALLFLAKSLSRDFPASILVTIHLPSYRPSSLDELLGRAGALPASFAVDGERLKKGRIYIAPPDRHLILDGDRLSLGSGPRENNARPAIDPMMRSTAVCCGFRSVGVVLTGTLGDGASGLWALQQCGGMTVVQDPKDAAFAEMPMTALNRASPDHVVPLADMPALLHSLTHQPAAEPVAASRSIKFEVAIARDGRGNMDEMDHLGRRSVLACPDCGGVMWEIDEGELVRYRCHVGHTYTAEVMSVALDDSLRRALAAALRALEERVALARKLYRQAVNSSTGCSPKPGPRRRASASAKWKSSAHRCSALISSRPMPTGKQKPRQSEGGRQRRTLALRIRHPSIVSQNERVFARAGLVLPNVRSSCCTGYASGSNSRSKRSQSSMCKDCITMNCASRRRAAMGSWPSRSNSATSLVCRVICSSPWAT